MKKLYLYVFFFIVALGISQTTNKKYLNTNGNFSVELPNNWSVLNDTRIENRIAVCVPTLDKELKEFANCFEGTIFYIEKYKTDLATTLTSKGYVVSNDSVYTLDKKNKRIEVSKNSKKQFLRVFTIK